MIRTFWNASDTPIVVDDAGRTIGGRSWGTADTTAEQVKSSTDAGTLIEQEPLGDDASATPEARAAHQRTAEIGQRAEQLTELDKDRLSKVATEAGVPAGDDAHKDELVRELAYRTDVDVPRSRTRKGAGGDEKQEG